MISMIELSSSIIGCGDVPALLSKVGGLGISSSYSSLYSGGGDAKYGGTNGYSSDDESPESSGEEVLPETLVELGDIRSPLPP